VGNTITSSAASITLTIGTNPSTGVLSGATTVSAASGVATFSNLSIDKAGTGYTLSAASTGLTGATSAVLIYLGQPLSWPFYCPAIEHRSWAAITPAVTVTVQDAGGFTVTNSTASIAMAFGAKSRQRYIIRKL